MAQKKSIAQTKNKKKGIKVMATPKKKQDEITAIGRALRMVGGMGGRYLGGMVGVGNAGAGVGTGLGAALSRWLGQGDYTVAQNSIVRQAASGVVPSMHKNDQSVIVRHKEFITEVTGKQSFTVQRRFSINPGLGNTFPWLSGIASQYSEYRVKGMVYHYVPSSGDAVSSTNAALGTVMLQTSYRANEAQATSKVELLNEYWSSESKPSEAFCHPIECSPEENPFNIQYVRTGDVPASDNVLLYDLGVTTLAVSGQQADDIVLGDLWVTYEIELRKPRLTDLTGESLGGLMATATANLAIATPFGSDTTEAADTTTGGTSLTSTALTLQRGNVGTYQLTLYYQAATAANCTGIAISGTGSAAFRVYGAVNPRVTVNTTSVGAAVIYTFQITNPNTVTVITPTFTTLVGATGLYIHLTRINPLVVY
jgi:hypothetical protein